MNKLKAMWLKYKEYALYLVFGALTTVVNYVVYFALTRWIFAGWTGASADVWLPVTANAVSWIAAVAFAYITNRKWVFESKNHGAGPVLKEIGEFALGRLITLGLEEVILFVFSGLLHWNDLFVKIAASILTIILNYVFSKFIIFKNNDTGKDTISDEEIKTDEKD